MRTRDLYGRLLRTKRRFTTSVTLGSVQILIYSINTTSKFPLPSQDFVFNIAANALWLRALNEARDAESEEKLNSVSSNPCVVNLEDALVQIKRIRNRSAA